MFLEAKKNLMGSLYKNYKLGYIKKDEPSYELAIQILKKIGEKINPVE
jgi:hypothetical protein